MLVLVGSKALARAPTSTSLPFLTCLAPHASGAFLTARQTKQKSPPNRSKSPEFQELDSIERHTCTHSNSARLGPRRRKAAVAELGAKLELLKEPLIKSVGVRFWNGLTITHQRATSPATFHPAKWPWKSVAARPSCLAVQHCDKCATACNQSWFPAPVGPLGRALEMSA